MGAMKVYSPCKGCTMIELPENMLKSWPKTPAFVDLKDLQAHQARVEEVIKEMGEADAFDYVSLSKVAAWKEKLEKE